MQSLDTKDWACKVQIQRIGGARFRYKGLGARGLDTKDWACKVQIQRTGGAKFRYKGLGL